MNDKIFAASFNIGYDLINLYFFLFDCHFDVFILLMRLLVQVITVIDKQDHQCHNLGHLNQNDDHRWQDNSNIVGKYVCAEGEVVSNGFSIRSQSTDEFGFAVYGLRLLFDFLLGLIEWKFIHQYIFVQMVTYSWRFVKVSVCKVVWSEEKTKREYDSKWNDNNYMTLVVFRQINIGTDVVVVVVWKKGHKYHRDSEDYVLLRFVIDSKSIKCD